MLEAHCEVDEVVLPELFGAQKQSTQVCEHMLCGPKTRQVREHMFSGQKQVCERKFCGPRQDV